MNVKKIILTLGILFFLTIYSNALFSQNWIVSDFLEIHTEGINLKGNPKVLNYEGKKAVHFDGANDGVFINKMPLAGLNQFTIEVIFKPESGGNFEQRFFHCGEIRGDRVLLELRANEAKWYFDAFIKTGDHSKALIEPKFTHPLNHWYQLAFVVDYGKLTTYINGKKELEATIDFSPIETGKTSIGVRQNEESWFKGAIEQIRITPKALRVDEFLLLNHTKAN